MRLRSNAVYRYIAPTKFYIILVFLQNAIITSLLIFAMIGLLFFTNEPLHFRIIVSIIFSFFAVLNIYANIVNIQMLSHLKKTFLSSASNSDLNIIEEEFNSPIAILCNGKIRLGANYIFGKNSCCLTKYTDILHLYQSVHKTNGFEDSRRLVCKIRSSRHEYRLCKLKTGGKSDNDISAVATFIKLKNPNVKLGYK